MDGAIEIPSYFLCPISLQIMRDPVTLCTGITYDRDSIERWVFSDKNKTCPATKQSLPPDADLTPNHTLRRLIQAWCTVNASYGFERIPTPKPPVDKTQIIKLINDAKIPHLQMKSLRKLKSLALESESNKRCIESSGAIEFLATTINKNPTSLEEELDDGFESITASDEALSILYYLQISGEGLRNLVARNGDFIGSLTLVLQGENYQSRAFTALLLNSIFEVVDPVNLINLRRELFGEIVRLLNDQKLHQVTKAVLKMLGMLCPWGRNRIKAVEAGAVPVLIELLWETSEKRPNEMILVVLDQLCGCAEGRAELVRHCAGIAVVSKKILRISNVASERGVRILASIARFSATRSVLQEMLQVGVVSKLCLVLQVACEGKTKEKARDILRLHSKAWKHSSCVPGHLLMAYPF